MHDPAVTSDASGHRRDGDPPRGRQEISEADDIRGAVAGDGEAYRRLIERHQPTIAAYMWRFSRDPAVCEELVHEVFVEAYFSLRSYRGESPWLHWLRCIATRTGYRHWQRRARRGNERSVAQETWRNVASSDATSEPSVVAEAAEAAAEVHATLERLAPRDRLVLTLLYLEGCSVETIAELTGWSRSMVKVQAHRARGRLRKLLDRPRRVVDDRLQGGLR